MDSVDDDAPEQSHPDSALPRPASSIPEGFYAVLVRLARLAPSVVLRRNMPPIFLSEMSVRDGVLLYRDADGVIRVDDAYAGGGFGAVPASDEAIVGLPETTVVGSEAREKECVVCMESYEAGDTLRTMPCSHVFHEGCIFGWLHVSRLCPLCRFRLPAEADMVSDTEEDGDEAAAAVEEVVDDHGHDDEEEPSASASFFLIIDDE